MSSISIMARIIGMLLRLKKIKFDLRTTQDCVPNSSVPVLVVVSIDLLCVMQSSHGSLASYV